MLLNISVLSFVTIFITSKGLKKSIRWSKLSVSSLEIKVMFNASIRGEYTGINKKKCISSRRPLTGGEINACLKDRLTGTKEKSVLQPSPLVLKRLSFTRLLANMVRYLTKSRYFAPGCVYCLQASIAEHISLKTPTEYNHRS